MKTRTQRRMRLSAPKRYKPQPKEKNIRPLVWALLVAFGLLMLSHMLSGCAPLPTQAKAPTYPQPYTSLYNTPTPAATEEPAPSRAHPRPTETPSTRVSDVTIRAIVSTGYPTGYANLRSCPSTACSIIGALAEGTQIYIAPNTGETWRNILSPLGQGWMYATLIKTAEVK